MSKTKNTKTTKGSLSLNRRGICELLVVVSILWMIYVIIFGLDDTIRFVMAAPAGLYAAGLIIRKFNAKG